MSTPHNSANPGDIAKLVLMPGDPLRAKMVADTYLEDVVCFNEVRGMYGFTGTYKGVRVSVMASGMGMPSIGIYSRELYEAYGVQNIMRIGSAGAIQPDINLKDIVMAMGASMDSNYGAQYELPGTFAPIADFDLLRKAAASCERHNFAYKVGNVLSSDVFYSAHPQTDKWRQMGVLAVEMEASALYMNAAYAGPDRRALVICTISDHVLTGEVTTPEQRQTTFTNMVEVALDLIP